jgi:hypothetical protein
MEEVITGAATTEAAIMVAVAALPPAETIAAARMVEVIRAEARAAGTQVVGVHTATPAEAITTADFHPVSSLLTHRREAP